ncbi:NUDIX hydrolase [Thermodesulforhabdus norvegica]|uniref:Mutator mutT protein n=1 Tax=Thermodesulforhabdus norvegica TaxID=39841 RepID=A0A1I4UWR7_9BACT|nr:NUDIX hydrolase [Thermodesulforhabdus norvegica]SFM93412.1 mutator mutT protein [Thermodesulforhabdus norvegica]
MTGSSNIQPSRTYPDRPLIGVGAVVIRDKKVLLVRRANEPSKGLWSIPGGLVRTGETLEEAVKREILEETGIPVRVHDVIAILDRIIPDQKGRILYHYVLVDFLCTPLSKADPVSGSDAEESKYVSMDELDGFELTTFTKGVIHRALNTLSSHEGANIYLKKGLK